MILAYFSPEVVLPVASVVTAVFGLVMMVGRAPFRVASRVIRVGVKGLKRIIDKSNI